MAAAELPTGEVRPESDRKPMFSVDAARAGVEGDAVVAFVVLPNGRVDRESRTLIHFSGHQIHAKHLCDFLLSERFTPRATDARGVLTVVSVSYYMRRADATGGARPEVKEIARTFMQKVGAMSREERRMWLGARPPCTAIKIGIDPLYGPPPA